MFRLIIQRPTTAHMQFLRYFFVGGTSAVVDLFFFAILTEYVGLHYFSAAFVAYMLGLTWNHILSIIWVFESKHHRLKEVAMVILIAIGGLLWTELILYIFIEFAGIDPIISKMVSQGVVLFWNFGLRKLYVFH